MASLSKVCRRGACGRTRTGAWMQVVAAPDADSDCRSCDILCAAMAVFRGTSSPSRLPGRLLLIRRGFGCLALGFAQRSLLLLCSLFFLGACACCPLSLGPVSTVIRLECHWLPPCAAGCFSAPRLYIRTRSSFARPCHPAACWAI